jgi:hypothetical protein
MEFEANRVLSNIREATTEDLLDRTTVYRPGMEEEALVMIEAELRARGVSRADVEAHAERRGRETLPLPDGTVVRCGFCTRPAVRGGWGWHYLWGVLPVFPRYFFTCVEHHGKVWAPRPGGNAGRPL